MDLSAIVVSQSQSISLLCTLTEIMPYHHFDFFTSSTLVYLLTWIWFMNQCCKVFKQGNKISCNKNIQWNLFSVAKNVCIWQIMKYTSIILVISYCRLSQLQGLVMTKCYNDNTWWDIFEVVYYVVVFHGSCERFNNKWFSLPNCGNESQGVYSYSISPNMHLQSVFLQLYCRYALYTHTAT